MELMRVISANITAVGYDPTTATMQVQFKNGDVYAYQNVEPETYQAMVNGDTGRYFASIIKPQRYRYVFTKLGNLAASGPAPVQEGESPSGLTSLSS